SRLIHQCSKRANKPFIALNCGALPPTLVESTLFGTMRGAYTGAENSQGYLELANGGTLFLDELNAMPIEMQSKLLRFLQDKTFWRLGGQQPIHSDVR
ncbi:sigma 54-interacting transcriptional regulator, partial [Pseudomonas aeruginosa]|nr:sigma 54-interacting transcriptional regulator [Pseudomonas aeruginosa]